MASTLDDVLASNRSALDLRPDLLRILAEIEPYPGDRVQAAKDGTPVLFLPDPQNPDRLRPQHSKYRPLEEAARLLPDDLDPTGSVILFGGGFGFAARAFVDRMTTGNRLVWIEADPRALRTAIAHVDLSAVLSDERVWIFLEPEPAALIEGLRTETARFLGSPVDLVSHEPSVARNPAEYERYRNAVKSFFDEAAVNVRTAFYLSRVSLENQCANLADYSMNPGVKFLENSLAGEPAILVSAGPSLKKNMDALKSLEGRVTTLVVSTALRPVVERGIRPDFTCVIDYHRVSKRYFDGFDAEIAPPIVIDLKSSPEVLDTYTGPKLFPNDLVWNTFFDGIFGDRGDLEQGSTVAHTGFRFLRYLGADPIILVGQDLSYPGGLVHVPGTAIQQQEYPSTHRFYSLELRELEHNFYQREKLRRIPGNVDDDVLTDEIFYTYVKEFERLVQNLGGRTINATEGGAKIEGAEISTLAEVIAEFGERRRPDLRARIDEARRELEGSDVSEKALELLRHRKDEVERLRKIYSRVLRKLDDVIERNDRGEAADRIVLEVHELREEAKRFGKLYLMLSRLAQSDGWRRLHDDRRLDAEKAEGVAKQLAQAERDRRFVQGLHHAAEFLSDALDTSEARFRQLSVARHG